jgi:hypothetical protein
MENGDNFGDEIVAERGRPSTEWLERTGLLLHGRATDQVWAMRSSDGLIGLYMDSGDAGVVYLTENQARNVIDTLQKVL